MRSLCLLLGLSLAGCTSTLPDIGAATECGNGVREGTEACDDGFLTNDDQCLDGPGGGCVLASCGDGFIWSDGGTETCDDSNDVAGDGCSVGCLVEVGWTCSGEPSTCACQTGYIGADCRACAPGYQDGNYDGVCSPDCGSLNCGDHGDCGTDTLMGSVLCQCDDGYSGGLCERCADGYQDSDGDGVCERECSPATCGDFGDCVTDGGHIGCECAVGYQDNDNNLTCVSDCGPISCDHDSHCEDDSGEAMCVCDAGYQDADSDLQCMPTCATAALPCGSHSSCGIVAGLAQCVCADGYQDNDGDTECLPDCASFTATSPCSSPFECSDGGGTAACVCPLGMTGPACTRCRIHVDADVTTWQDGRSWATAYADLTTALQAAGQAMVAQAHPTCSLWIAGGNYTPPPDAAQVGFRVLDGLSLIGGFAGTEQTLEQRPIPRETTLLTGEVDGVDQQMCQGSLVCHVLDVAGDATLDNLYVLCGDARQDGCIDHDGGAIRIDSDGEVSIEGCWFGHSSAVNGGGVSIQQGDVTLRSVLVTDNGATSNGGGLMLSQTTSGWTVDAQSLLVTGNSAATGGGMYLNGAQSVSIRDSSFLNNDSTHEGAGATVIIGTGSRPGDVDCDRCAFVGNHATTNTGGIHISESTVTLRDCVIAANTHGDSADVPAGISYQCINGGGESLELFNCTVAGNRANPAGTGSNAVQFQESGAVCSYTIENSIIADNDPGSTGEGIQYNGFASLEPRTSFVSSINGTYDDSDMITDSPSFSTWTSKTSGSCQQAASPDGTTTACIDTGAVWTPGALVGMVVELTNGAEKVASSIIAYNTSTTFYYLGRTSGFTTVDYAISSWHLADSSTDYIDAAQDYGHGTSELDGLGRRRQCSPYDGTSFGCADVGALEYLLP